MLPSTTEQTESSLPSDSGGELKVQMWMVRPEIILVEDATKLKTEALMMTVSTIICSSLYCNNNALDRCGNGSGETTVVVVG